MRNIAAFIGISFILMTIGCKKSPELETEYLPIFNSNVEVNVTETQVGLKAVFSQPNTSLNKTNGFEWSEKSGTKTTMFTSGASNSGELALQIDTALRQSNQYKVRAWIKVGDKMFYSSYAYFAGLGYPDPQITSLSKSYAYWGETIYINGRYFSENNSTFGISVTIDNLPCRIVSFTENKIGVAMPDIEIPGKKKIVLNVSGKTPQESELENYRPEVFSVSPLSMNLDGEITIKGKFHSEYRNSVVPVKKGTNNYDYSEYSVIQYADDEIILKRGTYMNCDSLYQIYFRLKQFDYDEYKYLNSGFSVKRTGNWVRLKNTPFTAFDKSLTCNGKGYVIQFPAISSNFPFWRYDPLSDQWTKMAPFPGNFRIDPVFVECNGFIYCGLGKINNMFYELMTDFWKYDPVTNAWSKCADLNFKSKYGVSIFGANIQNTVYVFSEWNNQMAKYSTGNNSWEISDCYVPRLNDYARNLQHKGEYYFYGDIVNNSFYKYDLNSSKFENLNIQNWTGGVAFECNDRVFAEDYCSLSEIDFANTSVIELPEYFNNVSLTTPGQELFIINAKPYFFFQPNGLSTVKIE